MTTNRDTTRRATTTTATLLALAASALILAPGAAATGYLINVEAGSIATAKTGTNPLGTQGDTLDVGVFNHQCSDEGDVVDVGVANKEGTAREDPYNEKGYECTDEEGNCQTEEGGDTEVVILGTSPLDDASNAITVIDYFSVAEPDLTFTALPVDFHDGERDGACTDDNDIVDAGVLNHEGRYDGRYYEEDPDREHHQEGCDKAHPDYYDHFDEENDTGPDRDERGDRGDTVDAGVLNWECRDQDDLADAGALNCEIRDTDDGIDVGALNDEVRDDSGDTLDVSVFAYEVNDGPDGFGVNLLPFRSGPQPCEALEDLFLDRFDPAESIGPLFR